MAAADMDGDGALELLLTRSFDTNLVLFTDGRPPLEFGDTESEDYSISLADVDGDGVYDLVMGVPYGDLNDTGDGYVSIWSGQISGDLSTLDADIVLSNSEASSYAALGSSVKGAFDWDGDGYDDLFVGAPRQDIDDGSYSGAAFIVLGPITGDTDLALSLIHI